jgi:hypothetical protein
LSASSAARAPRNSGQIPDILAIHRQHIESAQLNLSVLPARVQRVEIGDAVNAQNDSLAIDDELLAPVSEGGLSDPGEALRRVIAAAGNEPHAVAIAFDAQAVTTSYLISWNHSAQPN